MDADPLPSGSRVRIRDDSLEAIDGSFPVGWTLRYGARVRDRRGRSSPLVVSRDLVPVEPPATPTSVTAVATAGGVQLKWVGPRSGGAGEETPAHFNVYRAGVGKELPETPVNAAPLEGTEFLDTRVQTGGSYVYVVRTVITEAPLPTESASSVAVEVRALDLFPPEAPAGLVVVQEGAGVRLFWKPNVERDLAGYRVYRRAGEGAWARVGPEPVGKPQYLDRAVRPGDVVSYRVTAIDRAEPPNESEPSEPTGLTVADDPDGWKGDGR